MFHESQNQIHFQNIINPSLLYYKLNQRFKHIKMVYIRINQTLQQLLPKQLPNKIESLTIQNRKYLKYKDFKLICKNSSKQLYKYVCKNDIISQIDIDRLLELSNRTPQQKKMIQQLKNKHDFRLATSTSGKTANINNQLYYYGNSGQQTGGNNIKQLTDSVSFGVTFIFSFFMAGITGYFFAQYFFHFQLTGRLMVSIVFIFATIFVETWLYIIKQTKANHKVQRDRKQWEKDQSTKAQYSLRSNFKYKVLQESKSKGKMKKQ